MTRKTQSVSYRIDAKVLEEIIRDAELKQISTNTLVNQVLRNYAKFYRYRERLPIIPAPKPLLADLINCSDERMSKSLAERAFRILKDWVMFTEKRQDLAAFLHALEEYVNIAGIASDHRINGSSHVFIIQHDMGLKWSEFTKELLGIIFEKLADKRADFELTESSVVATIELPESIH